MRRLFWKEWRERWGWLCFCALAVIATPLITQGHCYLALEWAVQTPWTFMPLLAALLAGLSGYGSELQGERAAFLYSRAVTWKQLLGAKILLGCACIVAATVVAAIVCRYTIHPAYLPFFMPRDVILGGSIWGGITMGCYLIGMGLSIAWPGLWGGILAGLLFIAMCVLPLYWFSQEDYGGPFFVFSGMATPLVAGVILARFGITLTAGARFRRFLLLIVLLLTGTLIVTLTPPGSRMARRVCEPLFSHSYMVVNPTGAYDCAMVGSIVAPRNQMYMVEMSSGRQLPVPVDTAQSPQSPIWINADHLLMTGGTGAERDGTYLIQVANGTVQTYRLQDSELQDLGLLCTRIVRSPDGKRIIICDSQSLRVLNIQTRRMQVIDRVQQDPDRYNSPFSECWWQSNAAVGYLDPVTEERIIVAVE